MTSEVVVQLASNSLQCVSVWTNGVCVLGVKLQLASVAITHAFKASWLRKAKLSINSSKINVLILKR